MNKFNKILSLIIILAGIIFIVSCVREKFNTPSWTAPRVDFKSNCKIDSLKKMEVAGTLKKITSDLIIQGIVTANDESGNYYKEIVIQDNTAGIEILMNNTGLYTQYKVGQRVFIKCNGLYIGDYGSVVQLGSNNNGSIGQIPIVFFNTYIFPDSLPGATPAPKVLTIPSLAASYEDMLVRIDNLHFDPADTVSTFAPKSATTTEHYLYDNPPSYMNILAIRTSSYANFSADKVPYGKTGSILGILSYYSSKTEYEFYLRDRTGLINWH
jgi:hypothetical protein